MTEHLVQWAVAEYKRIHILLFVYSRSTGEYGIHTLYPNYEKLCLPQKLEISLALEGMAGKIMDSPDDFLSDFNTEQLFWKRCVTEFRSGPFLSIAGKLIRENRIR